MATVTAAVISLSTLTAAAAESKPDYALSAYRRGAFDEAAAEWQKAVETSRHANQPAAQFNNMVNLATAYQALGQQAHAVDILEEAVELAEKLDQPEAIIHGKNKLGLGLAMMRQNERAEELLRESLEMARKGGLSRATAEVLGDLGNLLATERKYDPAMAALEESSALARESGDKALLARVLCNSGATAARAGMADKAERLNGEALDAIYGLEPSHEKAFLLLTTAQTDQRIKPGLLVRAHRSARSALDVAEGIHDRAMTSDALGLLGQFYEQDKQLDHAVALTRRAAFAAQQAQSPDALYRWQWQTGRLLKAQGKAAEAIGSYRGAVQSLQPIRHDLAIGYGNAATQLSFRESLGPLFFELADLLLAQAETEKDADQAQGLLREARDTVEQLKAVELEDYFQDDCVNVFRAKSEAIEKVDAHSAIMYLIPLPNRTEVLVSLASGMHRFRANMGAESLIALVREFRRNLETRTTYGYLAEAQQLYDLIIRPIRGLLLERQIDTLVFVPDGALQTIPLASLHDGKRFLIEEFAVTVTPGLSLVEPRPIERKNAHVLLSGLSDAVQGFPSLDFVPDELRTISAEYRSEKLLNASFKTSTLENKLADEQFSIVHIASHGQFDRDARNTFVLTYDGKLTLNKLEALIRPSQYRGRPVELLVLSACQTAAGDDRAALGLAGIAVKAGARSALASLWFVNDQSTAAFTSELYAQLRQSSPVSRAKAVQAAQIKMLEDRRYRHPCYWAPYLLIGNWL